MCWRPAARPRCYSLLTHVRICFAWLTSRLVNPESDEESLLDLSSSISSGLFAAESSFRMQPPRRSPQKKCVRGITLAPNRHSLQKNMLQRGGAGWQPAADWQSASCHEQPAARAPMPSARSLSGCPRLAASPRNAARYRFAALLLCGAGVSPIWVKRREVPRTPRNYFGRLICRGRLAPLEPSQ